MHLLFFDTETTGLPRNYKAPASDLNNWPRIVQIAWLLTDASGKEIRGAEHIIKPNGFTIPSEASKVHGITTDVALRKGVELGTLTKDQMTMVDVVAANPRVLCSGGAGTGKTFLALELARRWTAEGMNVVLVCRSPWLKSYLEARFSIPKLTVSLVGTVQTACRRQGLKYFDALIVDEGQDLFDMGSLDSLDSVLHRGLTEGRWCFFHDTNNQSGFFGSPDQDAVDYLSSMQPTRVPLNTNCRNTRIILEKVQTSLGADMGTRGAGDGPKIREHSASSKDEATRLLVNELFELVDHGGLSPGEVTILSPLGFEDSCVAGLPEKLKRQIMILDEYSLKSFPSVKTSFAEIVNFKGLENEAYSGPRFSDSELRW